MTNLIERATLAIEQLEAIKTELALECGNKNIPHEVRWELFQAWNKLGISNSDSYYEGFDDICMKYLDKSECFIYDGLIHVDRYQTVDLVNAIGQLLENLADKESSGFEDAYTLELTKLGFPNGCPDASALRKEYWEASAKARDVAYQLPIFQEFAKELQAQLMEDGVSSFTYDW